MRFLQEGHLDVKLKEWSETLGIDMDKKIQLLRPALLVLDMQNEFLLENGQLPVWGGPAVVLRVKRLINAFHSVHWPVVYTRHLCIEPYRHKDDLISMKGVLNPEEFLREGSPGAEIHNAVYPCASDYVVTKYRYSGFYDTPLDTFLRVNHTSEVVITGVATNICCETSAHDAFFRGYDVLFTIDGTGGTDEVAHLATLRNIRMSYGVLVTVEQVLAGIGTAKGVVRMEDDNERLGRVKGHAR